MTLARANGGGWATDDLITPVQINLIDTNAASGVDAIGGSAGVAYTPATVIDIAGAGLKISGAGAAARLQYGSRSITRAPMLRPNFSDLTIARQPVLAEAAFLYPPWALINLLNAGTDHPTWQTSFPNGCVINTMTILFKGHTAHAGAPGTLPKALLKYYNTSAGGAATTVTTATDTYGSAGAFEANHTFAATSIAHTVDSTARRYYIECQPETGANYVAGGAFLSATFNVTLTDQSEWV